MDELTWMIIVSSCWGAVALATGIWIMYLIDIKKTIRNKFDNLYKLLTENVK